MEELEMMEQFMEETKYKVYIQVDENNVVKRIDSEWNINDIENWIYLDEGLGDKYHHAQSGYLEKGLFDDLGRFNYKYVDGALIELTEEEKETLFPTQEPVPTLEERVTLTESSIADIENAMCENDVVTDSRIASIEDALCEITMLMEV